MVGGLKWRPKDFWRATPDEVFGAIAGHNRANRINPEPMTRDELDELVERYPDNRSLKDRGHGKRD